MGGSTVFDLELPIGLFVNYVHDVYYMYVPYEGCHRFFCPLSGQVVCCIYILFILLILCCKVCCVVYPVTSLMGGFTPL